MHHRLLGVLLSAFCILLVTTGLYLGSDHLTQLTKFLPFQHDAVPLTTTKTASTPSSSSISALPKSPLATLPTTSPLPSLPPTTNATNITNSTYRYANATTNAASAEHTKSSSASFEVLSATATSDFHIPTGTVLSSDRISRYISAIFDPAATELPRLECPAIDTDRYDVLRKGQNERQERAASQHPIDYFFALDLRECVDRLPRLLGSIVEVVRFLGPHRCALSIVEGNSPDGTGDVLAALQPFLADVGLSYFYYNSKINPSTNDRIQKLAQLRNLALKPLYNEEVSITEETTVLFLNDVAACAEDLLELVLQRRNLAADMTCAMDWTYVGTDPTFYDIWVARTIQGDTFFDVGDDGNWNSAWNLFWNTPQTKARFNAHKPFQVFACWNGATAFTAAPLLHGLRFRDIHADQGECLQGEPQLFCKDMWFKGYRKIAVIPSVNLEYSDERGADIKRAKGYVSERVKGHDEHGDTIEWVYDPPEQVKCMPEWERQSWRPWDESLS